MAVNQRMTVPKGPQPVDQEMDRFSGYESWSSEQLAGYFKSAGLGQYGAKVVEHKITGELAPLLTESDLKARAPESCCQIDAPESATTRVVS